MMPFEFVFFHDITLLAVRPLLKNDRPAYLAAALVAMFVTCMNYWLLLHVVMDHHDRAVVAVPRQGPASETFALISAPPVAAAAFTTFRS